VFFVFFLFLRCLFLFGSVRQIKPAVCQLLGARKYSASYRISHVFAINKAFIVIPENSAIICSEECMTDNAVHHHQSKCVDHKTSFRLSCKLLTKNAANS